MNIHLNIKLCHVQKVLLTKDWKYVRFIDRQPGYEWMYHTKADPKEKQNLAGNEKYADKKTQLKKRFGELVKEYN